MASIFHSLLMVIAGSTQKELARQIKYLKVENEILRAKLPGRITVTQKERQRLLKFGAKLGAALRSPCQTLLENARASALSGTALGIKTYASSSLTKGAASSSDRYRT